MLDEVVATENLARRPTSTILVSPLVQVALGFVAEREDLTSADLYRHILLSYLYRYWQRHGEEFKPDDTRLSPRISVRSLGA